MALKKRPTKVIRLNYKKNAANQNMASISIFGGPAEARMAAGVKTFVGVHENTGISLSPGIGNQINIQGLPQNLVFGGMLTQLPFPLSVIPITPFSPFPTQVFRPPLLGLVPTLVQISTLAALFPA